MFKAGSNALIIALMFIAFVGQSMTFNSSISCEDSALPHQSTISEQANHNDSTQIDTNNPEDCCGIECCDINCTCIFNACSSFVYFNTEISSTKTAVARKVIDVEQSKRLNAIATLRYRPPIFTS